MNQQLMDQRIYEYNSSAQAAPYFHQQQHGALQDCKSQALPQMNYPYYYYGAPRVESGFDNDSQMPPFSESQEEIYEPFYPVTSQRGYLPSFRNYADMPLYSYQDEQMQEPKHHLERQPFKYQQQHQMNQYPEQVVLFEQKQLYPEPYEMTNKFIPVNNHPFLYNGQYVCGGYPNQEIYTSIAIPQNQPQSYGCFPVMNVPQYEQQQQQYQNNQLSCINGNIKQEDNSTAPAVTLGVKEIETKSQINNIQVKLESTVNIEKSSFKKDQSEQDNDEKKDENNEHNASSGVSISSKKIAKTDKMKKKYKQSRQKNVFKNFGNALVNCIQNNFMIRDLIEKSLNHDNKLIDEFHSAFLKDSLNNLKNKEDFLQGWRTSEAADSPNLLLFKKLFKQVSLKFFTDYAEKYVNESDKLKNKDIHIKAIPIFIKGLDNVNELYKFKLS